jgi:transcriptional regulator NrdR family protein
MNCIQCNGNTKVIDSRNVRRRRECLVCKHRFTTIELLEKDVEKLMEQKIEEAAPEKQRAEVALKKPKAPKKATPNKNNTISKSVIKNNSDARRKIEDLREQRRLREDFDYLDPDYDYLPEKW